MKQPDSVHVGTKLIFRTPGSKGIIGDTEIDRPFLPFCSRGRLLFLRLQGDMVILPDGVDGVQGHHFCGKVRKLPLYHRLIVRLQTFQYVKNQLHLFRGKLRI